MVIAAILLLVLLLVYYLLEKLAMFWRYNRFLDFFFLVDSVREPAIIYKAEEVVVFFFFV